MDCVLRYLIHGLDFFFSVTLSWLHHYYGVLYVIGNLYPIYNIDIYIYINMHVKSAYEGPMN